MKSFKEIYKKYRNSISPSILGTSFVFLSTLIEFVACGSFFSMLFKFPIGRIKDGYALTLLGLFVWIYWGIIGCLYLPMVIIIALLFIPAFFWTIIFEFSASILNNDLKY